MPLWFHLLQEDEIERLQQIVALLRDERAAILADWFDRYRLHFGTEGTFGAAEFGEYYGADLDAVIESVAARDRHLLARRVRAVGRRMQERGVPFSEVIASLHLFEESTASFVRRRLAILLQGPDILLTFDKLSHVRMILLADSWFGAHDAGQTARRRAAERDLERLDPEIESRGIFLGLVGRSAAMRALFRRIRQAGPGRASVLVTGESGTGKELVARAVHECGDAPEAPFVAVNCAALPKELVESELFGHRRGAFSGAAGESLGLVRAADGGTLFLDEISEMSLDLQAKLLRVVQERRVRPVGATQETSVDVRFVASTNRDPAQCVAQGLLREDLFYRLKVHVLALPPLRERRDDVPLLAQHFIEMFAAQTGRRIAGLEDAALEALQSYAWPGNVRELMNVVESAIAAGAGGQLATADLPAEIAGQGRVGPPPAAVVTAGVATFEESERVLLARALDLTGGNKLRAAKILGISRKQLYAKIRKYAIAT